MRKEIWFIEISSLVWIWFSSVHCMSLLLVFDFKKGLFVFHYLFRGRFFFFFFFFKDLYWINKSKNRMRKINNSVMIPKNKLNIIISHS